MLSVAVVPPLPPFSNVLHLKAIGFSFLKEFTCLKKIIPVR